MSTQSIFQIESRSDWVGENPTSSGSDWVGQNPTSSGWRFCLYLIQTWIFLDRIGLFNHEWIHLRWVVLSTRLILGPSHKVGMQPHRKYIMSSYNLIRPNHLFHNMWLRWNFEESPYVGNYLCRWVWNVPLTSLFIQLRPHRSVSSHWQSLKIKLIDHLT